MLQTLSTRSCDQCGTPTYEANLTCHHCKSKLEPCAVSGYPVRKRNKGSPTVARLPHGVCSVANPNPVPTKFQ